MLDLCLECRACKSECPVGVDMARFKSEFLADYWERHGTPLRARLLAHIADALGVGQPLRPFSNWADRYPGDNGCLERLRRRNGSARPSSSGRNNSGAERQPAERVCTLFNDTFLNHYDPEIGIAAVEVLERGGCGVNVSGPAAADVR